MSEEIHNTQLFFIIGRSRSGTTLLRTMLDLHPNISVPNECTFILQLSRKYKKIKLWTPEIIESFIHHLKSTWLFENLKVDIEQLRNNLLLLGSNLTFQLACREVILQSSTSKVKSELKWIGDKNPSYSIFFSSIYSIFKNNCKYIYINRDYRDQYWSLLNAKFELPNSYIAAKRWVCAFTNYHKYSIQNTHNFHYLTYEDLVTNPENELNKICGFLNVPFDHSVIHFNDMKLLESSYSIESLNGIHKSLKEPLTNNKINSWKNNLSKNQLFILDFIAGKYQKLTGYKPVSKINYLNFLIISFPCYLLYWTTFLSKYSMNLMPFKFYLKLSEGAFLGKMWNKHFRK